MLISDQKPDLRLFNPLTLAFVGDGVYEMLAREQIALRYNSLSAKTLHSKTVELVCAVAQCRAFELIEPLLSEQELSIFKRGRNCGGITHPKHTPIAQYRVATGLEALFGWLYLSGENERLRELFQIILEDEGNDRQSGAGQPD